MIKVILESPYAGGIEENVKYARECMLDCLMRGEAPVASHLLYTQCLDDEKSRERALGMDAGFAWRSTADKTVVYTDLGISNGMEFGISHARSIGQKIEYRSIREEEDV